MMTRRLCAKPARIASVVSRSNTYDVSRSGTYSLGCENAGTVIATSRPNVLRTSSVRSGAAAGSRPLCMLMSNDFHSGVFGGSRGSAAGGGRHSHEPSLDQLGGSEMSVGLDDLLQPLFGAPVAAVGV